MATQGVLGAATLKEFEDGLHGELIRPGDSAYDEARSIWNGAHDARPAVIARCVDASDVRHAIGFARARGSMSPYAAAATAFPASRPATRASSSTSRQ